MTTPNDGAGTGGDMADQVRIDHDVLKNRISKLIDLYDDMNAVRAEVDAVLDRQDSSVWSSEQSVTTFRSAYVAQLRALSETMSLVRERIDAMRTALADSERALIEQDESTATLFESLGDKLDETRPPTVPFPGGPVPYPGGPIASPGTPGAPGDLFG